MAGGSLFIAACSPRRGGNSDRAAALLSEAWGLSAPFVRVADAHVRPCISCGYCGTRPGSCALDEAEAGGGASALFTAMCAAELSVLVAPIYFYHIPAQAKAWVDRSQRWWAASELPGKGKAMTALLIGARPRGDKLFEGAERSLRYMAKALGMEWLPSLHLYGLDEADALAHDVEKQGQIRSWAEALHPRLS